jgi:4-hydroxy-3-methylbut-2-enyl diphosphate reductase
VPSQLVETADEIDEAWLEDVVTLGLTSGASAPEVLVDDVCDWFRARGVTEIREVRPANENVFFRLPVEVRRSAA